MAKLTIETGTENDILRKIAKPVRKVDKRLVKLLQDMEKTMDDNSGCGLAAPQVGESIRAVIVKLNQQTDQEMNIAMVNPEVIYKSEETEVDTEGCLSIPEVFDEVRRPRDIIVKYLDKKGKEQMLKLSELNARVVLHEVDHLDGVLFVDKLEKGPDTLLHQMEKSERHLNI